jgi:hypothetical protein
MKHLVDGFDYVALILMAQRRANAHLADGLHGFLSDDAFDLQEQRVGGRELERKECLPDIIIVMVWVGNSCDRFDGFYGQWNDRMIGKD